MFGKIGYSFRLGVLDYRSLLQDRIVRDRIKSKLLVLVLLVEGFVGEEIVIVVKSLFGLFVGLDPVVCLGSNSGRFLNSKQLVTGFLTLLYPNLPRLFVKTIAGNSISNLVVVWLDFLDKPQLIQMFGINFTPDYP